MTRFLMVVLALSIGCSKAEEKPSKDEEGVEKDSKKKKKASKDEETDELTNEEACKRIGKLAKKEKPDITDEKLEKKTKQCIQKMEDEPKRKKCVVTCLADNETLDEFEKCERACRDKLKKD